jgi:hypothetical protein
MRLWRLWNALSTGDGALASGDHCPSPNKPENDVSEMDMRAEVDADSKQCVTV